VVAISAPVVYLTNNILTDLKPGHLAGESEWYLMCLCSESVVWEDNGARDAGSITCGIGKTCDMHMHTYLFSVHSR